MKYLLDSSTRVLQNSPKYALRNLEELEIENVKNFEAICKGTLPDGFFGKLRKLAVTELGDKILCLIPSDLLLRLQNLQELHVWSCSRLEMLHDMSSFSSSIPIFPNLSDLSIDNCDKLKYIFSTSVFRHLLRLKRLEVKFCSNIEVIISYNNDEVKVHEEDKVILSQLEKLTLHRLPSLRSFSRQDSLVIDLPSLETLAVGNCMNLKKLPLSTNSVPKLRELRVACEEEWFHGLEWEDQSLKSRLETILVETSSDYFTYD